MWDFVSHFASWTTPAHATKNERRTAKPASQNNQNKTESRASGFVWCRCGLNEIGNTHSLSCLVRSAFALQLRAHASRRHRCCSRVVWIHLYSALSPFNHGMAWEFKRWKIVRNRLRIVNRAHLFHLKANNEQRHRQTLLCDLLATATFTFWLFRVSFDLYVDRFELMVHRPETELSS